jgi:hypothetical protein
MRQALVGPTPKHSNLLRRSIQRGQLKRDRGPNRRLLAQNLNEASVHLLIQQF